MKRDIIMTKPLKSSFLSCEKDALTIIKKLFVESRPHSDTLKKLLIINTKDCIDENSINAKKYKEIIDSYSIAKIMNEGYFTLVPKFKMREHEEVKNYVAVSFDNFTQTSNPEYRDCIVSFDIMCHLDYWDLGDYKLRPLKIAGYIDGILNNARLSGIGTFEFISARELVFDENFAGYTLIYQATHGNDDKLPPEEEYVN